MKQFLFLVLASLVLILFGNFRIIKSAGGTLSSLFVPLERTVYQGKVRVIGAFSFLGYWQNGEKKLKDLEKQNRELSGLIGKVESCQKENADIRRLLGAPVPQNWRFLPAKVVGWENGGLLIDKGTKDKVADGMTAIYENIFVGKVTFVGEGYSRVETPKSSQLRMPVIVKDLRQEGVIGRGLLTAPSGKILVDQVLQEEKIAIDDFVLSSAESGYLPDLLIGKIVRIDRKEKDIFQRAEIQPLVAYEDLSTVFLVINK